MNNIYGLKDPQKNILNQLNHWHLKTGDGFYKFLAPCEHPWYRKGDSWTEELKLSDTTLRKYFKKICASYPSKKDFEAAKDLFQNKPFASYFDRLRKLTFYFKNPHFQKKVTSESQKKFVSTFGSKFAPIYTDKTNNSLYPPKSPLDQNSHKDVRNFPSLKTKEDRKGDLDQKSWNLAQEIHQIWQEKTNGAIPTPRLTAGFAGKLLKALRIHFSNSLELWKSYCESVSSSDFLMGKVGAFKAWLIWVIRQETIEKIKKGALGIKKPFQSSKEVLTLSKKEIEKKIQNSSEPKKIKTLRQRLLKKMGVGSYTSWIKSMEIVVEGKSVVFKAVNEFAQMKVQEKYGQFLHQVCERLGLKAEVRVEIFYISYAEKR